MTTLFADADDFMEFNSDWDILSRIHKKNPSFKITLFTIVGKCSMEWIEKMKKVEWIQMVPHGWMHETNRECEKWDYWECMRYLKKLEPYGLERGFKAPGWQISDEMYLALREEGYWVADQHYNDQRRPEGLTVFYPTDLHFHIGHLNGHNVNAIMYSEEMLSNLQGEFKFIGV